LNKEGFHILSYNNIYVRRHLEYFAQAWTPYYKKDLVCLEKVHRRAMKLVRSVKNLPYHKRLKQLNLYSVEYRRLRGILIKAYKIVTNKEDVDRDQFFTLSGTLHLRGHSKKIYKQHTSKTCRQKFFSQVVIDEWNQLPEYVIAADSLDSFKKRLDNHMKPWR